MGWLEPIILLPVGLLLQLSPSQVDTILLHELAHIRRKDYLVNLCQCFLESIFFFNPAVLWLNALIREEREHCCDDKVMEIADDKADYWRALLAFSSGTTVSSLAMPLSFSPPQLKTRLNRMIKKEARNITAREMILLTFGVVILSAFSLFSPPSRNLERQVAERPLKKFVPEPAPLQTTGQLVKEPAAQVAMTDVQRIKSVMTELVQERIVKSREDIRWFGISETECKVNGIKVSAELHKKLRDKYGIKHNYGLYYGPVEMTGTGVFFEKDEI